jgi:hypothetical protein
MATARGAWNEEYEVEEPVIEPTTEAPTTEVVSEVNDTIETPTVVPPETEDTPAAEVVTEPALETVETQEQVKEVIKEVEKIVEKYPEMDEHTKEIFDALLNGEENKILDYLSAKHKNYGTMSDYDVVKENLAKSNPSWTPDEVELEVRYKYGEKLEKYDLTAIDKELEPDAYADAVKHNKEVERNEILLQRDARDARIALEATKKEVKFPKIEKQEVQTPNQPTAEQLEQGRKDWQALVETEIPALQEFSFKVGDKETGYEDVAFKITDEQRNEQKEFFKDLDLNKMVKRFGWIDENGKQNVSKMAGDVLKLENLQRIVSSAYTQGKKAGTVGTVAEIKNLDLNKNSASSVESTPPDIGQLLFGHLNPK